MKIINSNDHGKFIKYAEEIDICRVFPLSIVQRFQSGSIYTSENCVLFRHRNNFTFLSGTPDENELSEIHELILSENLKFICSDPSLSESISQLGAVELIPRDFYSYPAETAPELQIPDGFIIRSIDRELFDSITGRVPPSLYWDSCEQFSKNGTGFCIMQGNEAASWAFTSAVSSEEADIGIETAEKYRHRGLALAAAAAVIREVLPDRRPTWTCQRSNRGSARIAEKLGFVRSSECVLIRKPLP
ncbi:GNAT family N-acetyltransferase [uncultured Ruminococcus sp.]|uniref:GNAT family N-acetyltransferase n=1 Tax=uncultured Ruminococcus sp. TaxID=165186 RepID=UPI0025F9A521|nr:GNAT family N-acetyltransferase [uncultured Ruminococcus sp.]